MFDEELEKISGGTAEEYLADKKILQKMGVYKKETKWVNENVQIALTALGKKIGLSLNVMSYNVSSSDGYHMNIDNKAGTAKNNYFINDELYSREDFWERIEMEWYMGELLGGHSL